MALPCLEADFAPSDEALAARAGAGVRGAFDALLVRYQHRIYRLAVRMCHNAADAEEICQETFYLAYRAIRSFHGDARFGTWLYRIAINQALMRQRAAQRRPVQSLELVGERAPAATLGEPVERVDDLLDRKRLTECVLAALGRLDESHRAALVLHDLEELSAEEVAEVLGVTPDAVRQRAHRARLELRAELRELRELRERAR